MKDSKIADRLAALGITMSCEFVPWSKSRSFDPKLVEYPGSKNLNWKVTLLKDGREVITADYSAGIGHAPSYKNWEPRSMGCKLSQLHATFLEHEVETGKAAKTTGFGLIGGKAIEPELADFVYSILLDGQAIDYPTYEGWADCYGMDRDSRKGEAMYRECLTVGLKLRAALGSEVLAELTQLFEDY